MAALSVQLAGEGKYTLKPFLSAISLKKDLNFEFDATPPPTTILFMPYVFDALINLPNNESNMAPEMKQEHDGCSLLLQCVFLPNL